MIDPSRYLEDTEKQEEQKSPRVLIKTTQLASYFYLQNTFINTLLIGFIAKSNNEFKSSVLPSLINANT